MEGQISMFDYLPKSPMERFWDRDISWLCILLDDWRKKYNLELRQEPSFRIWQHVPNYGYRLEYYVQIKKADISIKEIWIDLEKIIDEAEGCNIELSPCAGSMCFLEDEGEDTLRIYSTFKDAKRRKVK